MVLIFSRLSVCRTCSVKQFINPDRRTERFLCTRKALLDVRLPNIVHWDPIANFRVPPSKVKGLRSDSEDFESPAENFGYLDSSGKLIVSCNRPAQCRRPPRKSQNKSLTVQFKGELKSKLKNRNQKYRLGQLISWPRLPFLCLSNIVQALLRPKKSRSKCTLI